MELHLLRLPMPTGSEMRRDQHPRPSRTRSLVRFSGKKPVPPCVCWVCQVKVCWYTIHATIGEACSCESPCAYRKSHQRPAETSKMSVSHRWALFRGYTLVLDGCLLLADPVCSRYTCMFTALTAFHCAACTSMVKMCMAIMAGCMLGLTGVLACRRA